MRRLNGVHTGTIFDPLSVRSFERFLREIGVTGDLADVRFAWLGHDFELVSLRGIDAKLETKFPLYVPSKGGSGKNHIRVRVRGDRIWELREVRWDYSTKQYIIDCANVSLGNVASPVPLRTLRQLIGLEDNDDDPYMPSKNESWMMHLWRAFTTGSRAR